MATLLRIVGNASAVIIAVLQFTKVFEQATGRWIVGGMALIMVGSMTAAEIISRSEESRRHKRQTELEEKTEQVFAYVLKNKQADAVGAVVQQNEVAIIDGPIRGSADLLAVRLDMNDLHIDRDWNFSADFGVFARISVAVTDQPRTITAFAIDVWTIRDGQVQQPAAYTAKSERHVGDYFYRYKTPSTNRFGYAIEEDQQEEMPDLTSKLQEPLAPHTGKDGWVRFEMKGVRHELKECRIAIYAFDVHDQRYELNTDEMVVKSVEERAYVIPKKRGW